MRRGVVIILLAACQYDGSAPAVALVQPTKSLTHEPALARYAIATSRGSCARTDSAEVACWGGGRWAGALMGALTPRRVDGLVDIAGVAMFTTVSCAWDERGAVWCWEEGDARPT